MRAEIGQFQLFGFDLLIDSDLGCHLIEVNRNPGQYSPYIEQLVSSCADCSTLHSPLILTATADFTRSTHAFSPATNRSQC